MNYNMKTTKFLVFTMLCICFTLPSKAQYSVKEAFSKIAFSSLPFTAAKGTLYSQSVGISNPNNVMPDKLYKNFQCTDYFSANSDSELKPALIAKFQIPGTSWLLGAVAFGGITDSQTIDLIVIDNAGNIKSSLVAEVMWGWLPAKQFRITNNGKIIISKLVPTSSQSVSFVNFSQMSAYRIDEIYGINSLGQFIKENETKFSTKNYTKSLLDNEKTNIWDL